MTSESQCGCQKLEVNPLNDYVFKQYIECSIGNITGNIYDKAICTIKARIDYNNMKIYNPMTWSQKYQISTIADVLNSYTNLITANDKPFSSYNFRNNNPEQVNLFNRVHKATMLNDKEVTYEILSELEYAAKDGSVDFKVYNPREAKITEKDRQLPDDADSYKNSSLVKLGAGLINNAQWILPVGALLIGTVFLYPYVQPIIKKK